MWKIAIIDDDQRVLQGMKRAIPWDSLNAEWVGESIDGKQGLDLIRKQQPDIVITDVYMPVMNGLEMIEQLRKEQYQGKMVILSGYSDFEYARQALRLNVEDYLTKPASIGTIKDVLLKVIARLGEAKAHSQEGKAVQAECGEWTGQCDSLKHKQIVEFIIQYVNDHYSDNITICDLANKVFMSRNYLSQIFKKATGETFNNYVTQVRMEKAKSMIMEGKYLIYEIAAKVGYKNTPYFSTLFKKHIGVNPTDLLK